MKEVMNLPEPGPFGDCPACGTNDGFLNVERSHWFVCHEHQVRWIGGANLFSIWRDQTEDHWERNRALLATYREVEPWMC